MVNADGSLSPENTLTDVVFSGGGDDPFATLNQDGKTLGLRWVDALPQPVVSGNEATYPGVLPDVDLVVRALPDGFSHDFVVHTAAAAANPQLARIDMVVEHNGLDLSVAANGAIEVTDADTGEQFSVAPTPMMWDTPTTGVQTFASSTAAEQQVAELGVEFVGDVLTLTPDTEILTGDDTQYPVIIDPIWSGKKRDGEWGMVWSNFPGQISWKGSSPALGNGSNNGDAGAGQTCDSYTQLNCDSIPYRIRSFFRMNTEPVTRNANRQVLSANFKILQKHSASCSAGKARLWRTAQITASHSWNNQPSWLSDTADSAANANNGGSCGGNKYAKFDVTSIVKKVATSQNYSVTFGLRAVNESPSPALAQWRRYDSSTAVLEISYNSYAQVPTNVDTHGKGCSTDPANPLTFTTGSVKFTGIPRDPDGKVYPQFRVREATGDVNIRSYQPPATATSGKAFTWTANPPLADGDYRWRMRSGDNYAKSDQPYSSYTAYCYFTVDTEPPAQPEAILLDDDPVLGESVSFELTGPIDTQEFHYSLTHGPSQRVTATNGKATISVTPPTTTIDHILQVWVRDESGNESRRFDLLFTTRLPGEISWWPLAGDGADLGPGGNDLEIPETAEWVDDSFGQWQSAMQLDGERCASSLGSVVDTARSFTVSAWVKLDNKDSDKVVVSQAGINQSAFYLQYRQETDAWHFGVPGADEPEVVSWAVAKSSVPAQLGTWTHVTGTMDATNRMVQIYVDGILRGEAAMSFQPWASDGETWVGCSASSSGTWFPFTGAVHDVRLFDGVVTVEQAGAIAATPAAYWSLDATGVDSIGGNNLTFHGDHEWVPNRDDRPETAYGLELGNGGHAVAENVSVRSDESFTVMAWVNLNSKYDTQSIVSQSGEMRSAFKLEYGGNSDRFIFSMAQNDSDLPKWNHAYSETSPQIGQWYHITGVYDAAANRMHLYVNGMLESTTISSTEPWHGDGFTFIGAAGNSTDGAVNNFADAVIDDVAIYTGILDERRIRMAGCDPIATGCVP
ncbi:LamG-like jellyroll fold domain-containing protein [Stackebrandtia endophytica]|uniref:LamG-like jellyroll fold domain-containing protein n=1 Tax=Stackebrandtia endophytica TaxID=1496996 RepID=UPI00147769F8|nr:LamG-like jellyroll fold domain-containing protein [Stackebrandtia endophytica]